MRGSSPLKGTRDSGLSDTISESVGEVEVSKQEKRVPFLFFGQGMQLVGSRFPHQRLNPGPRQ